MFRRLHEQIRYIIETTPGLSQRGLALHMGLNPAAVNRMLYGRRHIKADEIPVIESYLGVKLDLQADAQARQEGVVTPATSAARRAQMDYSQDGASRGLRGFSDRPARALTQDNAYAPAPHPVQQVPVFRDRRGGDIVDWVPRHPLQAGIADAYALYVGSDDMQPRYFRGETVYVHPGKPAQNGADCVIEFTDGSVSLRRLLQKTADRVAVQSFHPARMADIALGDISAIYTIVGRG